RQEAEIKKRADEEERRRKAEAEERRWDEDKRRRQEAEDRRRLDEAEKRRRDEEQRGPEKEAELATKEAQRPQSEQEPQQPPKPWLLPLIGDGAASLPSLVGLFFNYLASAGTGIYQGEFIITDRTAVSCIISALYGGGAGMLIRRFGIPKAVTIPIIPAFLLLFALLVVFYSPVQHGYVAAAPLSKGAVIVNEFIWLGVSAMIAWLAFR